MRIYVVACCFGLMAVAGSAAAADDMTAPLTNVLSHRSSVISITTGFGLAKHREFFGECVSNFHPRYFGRDHGEFARPRGYGYKHRYAFHPHTR